jgi:hypothetical protein
MVDRAGRGWEARPGATPGPEGYDQSSQTARAFGDAISRVDNIGEASPLPRAQPTSDIVDSVFVTDRALYRFAHTIVTRRVVERGLLPQRAPFSRGTNGYALNVPLQ